MSECRRCSECVGCSHHWIEDMLDPDDDEFEPGDYGCKHCHRRGDWCKTCCGEGLVDGEGCTTCDGEGVVPISEEDYFSRMNDWAAGNYKDRL